MKLIYPEKETASAPGIRPTTGQKLEVQNRVVTIKDKVR
ncbi:hypothetical protein C723_1983 [Christiangramia flava JLT2011]|uniref:Uncharacterized protein n=1 Tax=Christiangramia flava JLT2011 TaxID=1229726 RepID=A0A1L7I5K0_9FLAO|nr:hypothetical protein GRFL_2154 [Christiangramia flava JLT2011]OSS38977.1 hypothetical protein C723_1983 [Christiangramia flava JLT2011]